MSKALILDFGGVVTRTLFETHDLSEAALGLAPGTLIWRGPFDPDNDPLWRDMQADRISERDYWMKRTREVGALVGKDWTKMADFVRAARGGDPDAVIRPEFREAVAAARAAGVRLAILSNELDLFYGADFRDKLPFLADFDVIVDATYTNILKPDPRAYRACLDELGLPAGDCVFVDDQLRNIEGAQAVGLQTVHFNVRQPRESYAAALELLGIAEGSTP
ncbi:HAD-IA family hydrolase [Oricola sp.]|uniref:HAD-IA family hydrolase n=1 Tax=Oricola sp. TaxID=1979950 RepID=UPI000C8FC09A|nr:HAD family hydrolase [Ahrensia sp.]|tara:strand:- start:2637 stop:3299 length:663 start_codon:yes stop_codon:yes gene_type:complete